MSVRVIASVFTFSQSELAERLTLIALADNAGDDGVAWPSEEAIAEKARIGQRTVRRSVAQLVARGEIEVQKAKRGRARINVYRVLVGRPLEVDYSRLPFEVVEPFTTGQSGRQSQGDDRPNTTVTTGQSGRPLIGREPSVEPSKPSASNEASGAGAGKVRKRDVLWEELVEVMGCDPQGRIERTRWNTALRSIKESGAEAGDIRARAKAYRIHPTFKDCALTPMALAANWAMLGASAKTKGDTIQERMKARLG